MPDFGVELHDWWPEGVFARYSDVNQVCAALIWGSRWPFERAFQMGEVVTTSNGVCEDVRCGVGMDIGDFFCDSAGSVGRHVELLSALD